MGFMEESLGGIAAGIKRAKAPPREGEAFAGRGLAVPMAGERRCRSVSFCFTECFILFHPSALSCCTRVPYLVPSECLVLFHPSVLSRFNRAFHLVAPECFILLHPEG